MKALSPLEKVDPTSHVLAPAKRPPSGVSSIGRRLTALEALYTLTLRQHLHGKRWLVLGTLFLLPALLAGLVRFTAPDFGSIRLEFLFVFMLIPQAILPLAALLYASGIIQDEQEDQTFTYILVRPIAKWAIYLVKLSATLTTTVVLTAFFTTLTYLVIYVGAETTVEEIPLRCLKAVGIHALAIVTYCCLFGVMSLLTKRALVLGFLYAAFFEGLLGNMPFFTRLLTVIYYARLIAHRSMEFTIPAATPTGKFDIAEEAWRLHLEADPKLFELPVLGASLMILLAVSFLCIAMGAFLCARREFHVKTPTGS